MKKNILAENLVRFGVKNLSESDVARLTEADPTNINDSVRDLNMTIKYINDTLARWRQNTENSWNTNSYLKGLNFSMKPGSKLGEYNISYGNTLLGTMDLPHSTIKLSPESYEQQFMTQLGKMAVAAPSNLKGDQQAKNNIGNIFKTAASKLKGSYAKAFSAGVKAKTQQPR